MEQMFDNTENNVEPNEVVSYARKKHAADENEGFFCRFTFGQFFALLILEVFTIFFVFYLGARFGPKILGFNQPGPIVVGEEKELKVATTADPEVQAMAKDIVDKADTPELKQRLTEMLKRPEERVAEEMPAEEQAAEPSNQVALRQAQPAQEVERGAVRIKSAPNAKYALQIGSYQQMNEANAMIQKWKDRGYPAYLMIADIPDRGRWYRVRLGGFSNRDEANKYKREFEAQEQVETIVVLNEQ
jgi:cell division septation protein DedD